MDFVRIYVGQRAIKKIFLKKNSFYAVLMKKKIATFPHVPQGDVVTDLSVAFWEIDIQN